MIETLHFSILIQAPKQKVWDLMLGAETYKVWTAEFARGSFYRGSWEKGAKIQFLGPDESGMTAVIAESKS